MATAASRGLHSKAMRITTAVCRVKGTGPMGTVTKQLTMSRAVSRAHLAMTCVRERAGEVWALRAVMRLLWMCLACDIAVYLNCHPSLVIR